MNLNKLIIGLFKELGLTASECEYTGTDDKYVIYTYEDETPTQFGDDEVLADTCYIQFQLIVPKNFNYFKLKKDIRNMLETNDFIVTSIRSFLGDEYTGTEKQRQIIYEANYSEQRGGI